MRTFRTIIAVVSVALVFTNCDTEEPILPDTTPPVITVPEEIIEVGLGDKSAVLQGVTAKDDVDGDLTKSINILSDVETVGIDTIKFEVSDKAGNKATATRVVMVSAKKLVGKYNVSYKDVISNKGGTYEINIFEEDADITVKVSGFHYYKVKIEMLGNGPRQLKIVEYFGAHPVDGDVRYTLSGTATFEAVNATKDKYNLVSFDYKLTPEFKDDVEEFTATCERLQ